VGFMVLQFSGVGLCCSGPRAAVGYQAVFVGEDDRLDSVAEAGFGEHRRT